VNDASVDRAEGGTMFEQLVNEAASRFNLSATSVSALLRGLLSLITDERTGGAEGFVDRFRVAGLGDVITSWFGGKDGRTLTASHVESALGTGTLDALAGSTGLSRAVVTSALSFLLPKVIGRLTPGGVLPSNSALLSQIASYVERPGVRARPAAVEHPEKKRGWPVWLPWAALAALSLAALMWFRAPAGTIDPTLTLSNRDGKVTYSGLVRDEATRTTTVNALRTTFGDANISGDLRVDPNVRRAAWLPRVGDLFAALKTPGVEFSMNGDAINLGGWLSAADRQAISNRLRGVFGAQAAIGSLGDAASEAVRAANDRALSALDAVGTSGASPDALVQAMNLAIINFPSGSSEIPADNMEIIRRGAEAIRRAPGGSTIEIRGHTDSTGDPARNLALSQARADAVKAAFVAAGVPASMLVANGYGDTRPRATNDTEFGRFQNRRIEYAAAGAR
jgi:outer membrane protein OmpA-like peptidoglycan-associated protein